MLASKSVVVVVIRVVAAEAAVAAQAHWSTFVNAGNTGESGDRFLLFIEPCVEVAVTVVKVVDVQPGAVVLGVNVLVEVTLKVMVRLEVVAGKYVSLDLRKMRYQPWSHFR